MEEPLQGVPREERLAQREAEARAGQQEALDESWVTEIAKKDKELQELNDALGGILEKAGQG